MTLIFDSNFIPLIKNGIKTVTFRLIENIIEEEYGKESFDEILKNYSLKIGDKVIVIAEKERTNIEIEITNIEIMKFSEISENLINFGGFSSKEVFFESIKQIYGQNIVNENSLFYIISFKNISNLKTPKNSDNSYNYSLFSILQDDTDVNYNDINCLKQRYNELKRFSCFTLKRQKIILSKQFYDLIYNSIVLTRKYFMCHVALSDDLEFLGNETTFGIFKNAQKTPIDITKHFSSTIKHSLRFIIEKIYSKPEQFAECVHEYFSSDFTDILLFGYSTFPAIYNFFCTVEVTTFAKEFLVELLNKCSFSSLVECVLVPFLMSAYPFLESLWNELHKMCMKTTMVFSTTICLEIFTNSLKAAVKTLSRPYIELIRYIIENDEELAKNVILFKFIYRSLKTMFSSGNNILPPHVKQIMMNMFNILEIPDNISHVREILNIFTDDEILFIPKQPHKPSMNISITVPYLITNKDLLLIYDIAGNSSEFSALISRLRRVKSSFDCKNTCIYKFDIFEESKSNFMEDDLITEGPDWELVRAWNTLLKMSKNEVDPIDYLNNLIATRKAMYIFETNEFMLFAYRQRIKMFENQLSKLDIALNTKLEQEIYENYMRSIERMYNILSHAVAECIVNEYNLVVGKFTFDDILGIMKESAYKVLSDNEADGLIPFEMFNATLDNYSLILDGNITNLQNEFMDILLKTRISSRKVLSKYPSCLAIITRYAQNLKNSLEENIGRQQIAMISLVYCVNIICEYIGDIKLRRDFFQYGLCCVGSAKYFGSFIIIQNVVDSNLRFCSAWKDNYYILWTQFSSLVMEIAQEKKLFFNKLLKIK